MAIQAKVTSTEALEAFRASMIVFLTKAKRSLDDSSEEVRRMRQWLQTDHRVHLEGDYRRKVKQLEQARAELMSVQLGPHNQGAVMNRQMAVVKLQREIGELEGKMRKLKGWAQNYDTVADPLVKRVDKLRQTLNDFPKAISYLVSVQKALDSYAESGGVPSISEPPQPHEPAPETPQA